LHPILPLGSAAFLLFGVVLVLLGATHDGIVDSLELDHTGFGMLGSALSLGIGAGVFITGPLVDRFPRRPIFLAATLLSAGALLSVDESMSHSRAMLHVLLMGMGTGSYDTLLNAVTVQVWRERSVRPMSFLHASVTVGAIATPALVAWLADAEAWVRIFRGVGFAYLGIAAWVACISLPPPTHDASHEHAGAARFLRPGFIALCIVAVAYIGIEAVLTLFAMPYAEGALGLDAARGGRAISTFWFGILAGRVLVMLPSEGLGARTLALEGVAATAILVVGIGFEMPAIEVVMGLAGLALAGVFPIMIALAGRAVPEAPGLATSLVAGVGSLGGFLLPSLTGALADARGIGTAMSSLSLWCVAIAVCAWIAHRGLPKRGLT